MDLATLWIVEEILEVMEGISAMMEETMMGGTGDENRGSYGRGDGEYKVMVEAMVEALVRIWKPKCWIR